MIIKITTTPTALHKITTTPTALHSGLKETQFSLLNSLDQYHLKPLKGNVKLMQSCSSVMCGDVCVCEFPIVF